MLTYINTQIINFNSKSRLSLQSDNQSERCIVFESVIVPVVEYIFQYSYSETLYSHFTGRLQIMIPETIVLNYCCYCYFILFPCYLVQIYDPENNRFEVPISLPRRPLIAAEDPLYNVSVTEEPFSFQVIRTDTNSVM